MWGHSSNRCTPVHLKVWTRTMAVNWGPNQTVTGHKRFLFLIIWTPNEHNSKSETWFYTKTTKKTSSHLILHHISLLRAFISSLTTANFTSINIKLSCFHVQIKNIFYLPLPEPLMMELCIKVFIILKRLMQLLKPSWKCSLLGSFSWHAHRAKATKMVIVQKLGDKMWTSLSRHQGRGLTHARCRLQEHRSDLTADILNAALSAETRFIFQLWETRRTPTHQVWLCLN